MALLKVLFGIRRIALSRMKIYDLVLIGCITAMTMLVCAVSSLEALSLGALFAVQVLSVVMVVKRLKIKSHVVVCCVMIFLVMAFFVCFNFQRLCAS